MAVDTPIINSDDDLQSQQSTVLEVHIRHGTSDYILTRKKLSALTALFITVISSIVVVIFKLTYTYVTLYIYIVPIYNPLYCTLENTQTQYERTYVRNV
jgi:hypothetical protein